MLPTWEMRTICSSFVWEEFKTFGEKKCYDTTSKIVINNKKSQA